MKRGPLFIALIYFLVGMLWIIYSDWLAFHLLNSADVKVVTVLQNVKGGIYVLLTTVLLYFLVKFSQRKLTYSHKIYLELFNNNPNPMMVYDYNSLIIIGVNEAAIKFYGYSRNEFLDITIDKLFVNVDFLQLNIQNTKKQFKPFFNEGVWQHKKRNGEIIYVDLSSERVDFEHKDGALILVKDVSKQKEYENQLKNITKNLEIAVAERTEELKISNKELLVSNQQLTISNKLLSLANQKIKEQSEVIQKQNQDNLNRIINSLNDVVWSVDLNTKKYVYLSNSVERVTGVPYHIIKNGLREWYKMIHPDDREVIKNRQKLIFSKGFSDTVYRLIKPNGDVVWIHDKVNLIKDKNDLPIIMEGLASDITPLKTAQDELIDYANRLKLILESITDGFFTLDKNFRFTRTNNIFENLVGIKKNNLQSKNIWDVFPKNHYPDLHSTIMSAFENKSTSEYKGFFEEFSAWLDFRFYPYSEGLSVFLRDVTAEKKIQQEISLNKKNLDALINNTTDLIWSMDKDFCLISANTAFLKRFEERYGIQLSIGESISHLLNDHSFFKDVKDQALLAFKGEASTYVNESECDENNDCFEVSYNPIYDDNGEVVGVGCFSRDISQRRQYEQERNHLIDKLISQNKGLEEFGYITSHKVRAPVANILGIIGLLKMDGIQDDHNKYLLNYLNVSANNLDQTIKDLTVILDMQKIGQEVKEVIEFEEILNEIKIKLAPLIREHEATIIEDFSAVQMIYTIKSSLKNILTQLITNSITYKKLDHAPVVHIKSFVSDGYIGLSISDNGLGIDLSKHKSNLFKLYKRFHLHTPGKGLGLYLVKSQVDALDGKLEVQSELNEGSTFKVYLKQSETYPVLTKN